MWRGDTSPRSPKREIETHLRRHRAPRRFHARSIRQGDGAAGHQRRRAEGAHPRRLGLVADHARQVQIEPAGSARRKSVASSGDKKEAATAIEYRPAADPVPRAARLAARQRRGAQERGRRPARPLPELRQGCGSPGAADVAVRDTISRQSGDLGQQQRDVLNNTPVGRLTPPEVTSQGVETFAICQKQSAVGGDTRASARSATPCPGSAIRRLQEVPEGAAPPGADRDPSACSG